MKRFIQTGQQRREFLRISAGASLSTICPGLNFAAIAVEKQQPSLDGFIGITTGGGLGKKR